MFQHLENNLSELLGVPFAGKAKDKKSAENNYFTLDNILVGGNSTIRIEPYGCYNRITRRFRVVVVKDACITAECLTNEIANQIGPVINFNDDSESAFSEIGGELKKDCFVIRINFNYTYISKC